LSLLIVIIKVMVKSVNGAIYSTIDFATSCSKRSYVIFLKFLCSKAPLIFRFSYGILKEMNNLVF